MGFKFFTSSFFIFSFPGDKKISYEFCPESTRVKINPEGLFSVIEFAFALNPEIWLGVK
ncbi:hypothetical protein SynBMKMC1_01357 [Synechococcus sp. BMK-MC-1]|nr:hypothetical protein SynBMKMC1_01357 [Synechococcus sp. BMK-MC-1]